MKLLLLTIERRNSTIKTNRTMATISSAIHFLRTGVTGQQVVLFPSVAPCDVCQPEGLCHAAKLSVEIEEFEG